MHAAVLNATGSRYLIIQEVGGARRPLWFWGPHSLVIRYLAALGMRSKHGLKLGLAMSLPCKAEPHPCLNSTCLLSQRVQIFDSSKNKGLKTISLRVQVSNYKVRYLITQSHNNDS